MNWPQLKAILWLRWCLSRNQSSRKRGLATALNILVIVVAAALCLAGLWGGLEAGRVLLKDAPPVALMGVWFGVTTLFLFIWTLGLVSDLQRSESLDLQRFMHLPVRLGQIFTINYIVSHVTVSIVVTVPAMIGLAAGLAVSRGPGMLLLIPLALSMVLMITAWTYCLRGWIGAMMTNPRRRRAIIMGISLTFILLAQLPNLYFNVLNRNDPSRQLSNATPEAIQQRRQTEQAAKAELFRKLVAAEKYIPPLWVPFGAQELAEKRAAPALLGTLGCLAIGALGLRRAYRTTVRFYLGTIGGQAARAPEPQTARVPNGSIQSNARWLEVQCPGVPEQATALALATFRSLLRAPEVKMAWASSFIVTLIMSAMYFTRSAPNLSDTTKPFVITGAGAVSLFLLVQFMANQFGYDRDGFRTLVLCPADRHLILLGKNLANLPVGLGFGLAMLALVSIGLHLSLLTVVAGFFQLILMLILASMMGNVLSILLPCRIAPGSMKPTKMPAGMMLLMVLCQFLSVIGLAPAFLPPLAEMYWKKAGLPGVVPVNLLLSAGLAALGAFAYWRALGPLGRLLQRRETRILNVVTAEVE